MIAARLAGGNLFLPFWGGGLLGAARSTRSSSEHSAFFCADLVGRASFSWGVVGGVLDCKCWEQLNT